jgi:hypothetical protein
MMTDPAIGQRTSNQGSVRKNVDQLVLTAEDDMDRKVRRVVLGRGLFGGRGGRRLGRLRGAVWLGLLGRRLPRFGLLDLFCFL